MGVVVAAALGFGIQRGDSRSTGAQACASSSCALSAVAASVGVPNPCVLIMDAEAAKLLGRAVTSRSVIGTPSRSARLCTWTGPAYNSFEGPVKATATLAVFRDAKRRFEKLSKNYVRVSGVGPSAFTNPARSLLKVWQNGYVISLHGPLSVTTLPILKYVAASALKHL